jgi:hypothetical protein
VCRSYEAKWWVGSSNGELHLKVAIGFKKAILGEIIAETSADLIKHLISVVWITVRGGGSYEGVI